MSSAVPQSPARPTAAHPVATVPDRLFADDARERRWRARFTATRHDLLFGSNAQLRSIVDAYAGADGQERFVRDFVRVWDKVMMLDRFELA